MFSVPGMDTYLTHEFDLTAVATADYFKGRCSTAESTLNSLHAAGREWFMSCFLNYKKAYDNHNAALKEQAGAERLKDAILFSVIFGALGGVAGGAVGGALRGSQETMRKAFGNIGEGALTDAAKDFTKAVARVPTQLQGRSGAGAGGGGAPPTVTSTAPAGVAGQGERAPAGIDPLDWMAGIDKGIAGERKTIGEQVVKAHEMADQCIANNPDCEFDWDPVEVVTEGAKIAGKPINDLGPVPSDLEYERSFWEVWLSQYAYKVKYYTVMAPYPSESSRDYVEVERNVGGKLRKRIQEVASKFGETADQWIERYGAPARQAAEAKKKKYEEE
jgi:hypothetical protein